FAAQILIDLDNLQFSLRHLAFGLGDRGYELATLALEPGAVALKRGQTGNLHEVVFPKLTNALKFLGNQRYLARLRILLGGEALDFVLQLRNTLFQLRFLAKARRTAKLKQLAFVGDGDGGSSLVGAGEQLRRKLDSLRTVALGFEACFACGEFIGSLGNDGEVGAGDRIVELDKNVAGLDAIAILHVELADNAAGRMLHLFHVGIDDDGALRDERAGDRRGCCPSADTECQQEHDQAAGQQVAVDGVTRTARCGSRLQLEQPDLNAVGQGQNSLRYPHAPALPLSGTILSGRGMASGRCSTLDKTSSFGPIACALP